MLLRSGTLFDCNSNFISILAVCGRVGRLFFDRVLIFLQVLLYQLSKLYFSFVNPSSPLYCIVLDCIIFSFSLIEVGRDVEKGPLDLLLTGLVRAEQNLAH